MEDEPLIAKDLSFILEDIGLKQVDIAMSYEDGIEKLSTNPFDLALLDINLSSERDGVDLADVINKKYRIPFIFITSYYNASTVARAKVAQPLAYLIKPFNQHDIRINVEMALYKFDHSEEESQVYVKGKSGSIKLELSEVKYLEAQDNYTKIVTRTKEVIASQTLKSIVEKLPESSFTRTHKSFAVRLESISMIRGSYVFVGDEKIPIGRTYKAAFQERISLL